VRPTILICVLLLSPATSATPCPGPPVHRVVTAALAAADLSRRRSTSWRRRARWAALLPRVSARLSRNIGTSEYWDLGYKPAQNLNVHLATRWEVQASWDLSRLVFDRAELRVSRRASQLQDQRRRLMQLVIQLYYQRCSLIEMRSTEPQQASGRLKVLQVTAVLDALTGGLFSGRPTLDD